MPDEKIEMPNGDRSSRPTHESAVQAVPAAEALSFLKEIKGAATWTDRDLAKSLNISMAEVKQVLAVMELQGYDALSTRTGELDDRSNCSLPGRPRPHV